MLAPSAFKVYALVALNTRIVTWYCNEAQQHDQTIYVHACTQGQGHFMTISILN